MGNYIDLTGQSFGVWHVFGKSDYTGRGKKPRIYWLCKCVHCGTVRAIDGKSLRGGVSKHCKCTQYAFLKENPPKRTHGESKTRLYRVWIGMRQRCNDPNNIHYNLYGGRGIKVCEEWDNSFEAFRDFAISHGYDPNAPRGTTTIDRIDPDGNYEPSNCRFVDMKVQVSNRRKKKGEF